MKDDFDKTEKLITRSIVGILVFYVLWILMVLSLVVGVVCIAWHFISKIW